MSKYQALFTSVNLLLGVGPIILPMPFFDAGIGLSSIWMVVICLLSYNSAMYISQSMTKLRQYQYNRQQYGDSPQNTDSQISTQENIRNELLQKNARQFNHADQFEILFGKKWSAVPSLAISIYLFGTSVSKCIMTGNIMSGVFKQVNILQSFLFWVFLFFLSGAIFSFRSIDKTKVIQTLMIGMRILSILMFIFGAIFLFSRDGVKDLTPSDGGAFNFSSFINLFSDSVFALMFHHSLPNIVNALGNSEEIRFVVKNSFIISGMVLIIIPITASMAFGESLGKSNQDLRYYNIDFQGKIDFIYWFTSFYVFLNVAAFSVYIIVIRTNILRLIAPSINANQVSKKTLFATFIILAVILLMSIFLQGNIQTVLKFTGGIFGMFIIFHMPCIQVYKARELTHVEGNPRNYIRWLPIVISILGFVFMGLTLYNIISGLLK